MYKGKHYTALVKKSARGNSALFTGRGREARKNIIVEIMGLTAVFAMGAFFFALWLAYEGWITPETFKGIFGT